MNRGAWQAAVCGVIKGLKQLSNHHSLIHNTYIWNLEKWYRWTYLQGKIRDTEVENGHVDTVGGKGRVGWTGRVVLAYIHCCCSVAQLCPTLGNPLDSSLLLCPWDFPMQEYWSGLPCPFPEDFPHPEIKRTFPALQAVTAESPEEPYIYIYILLCVK